MKSKNSIKRPEILSPVQDMVSLTAAIDAGADAVYFGIKGFNMRAGAKKFSVSDLKKVVLKCHKNNCKAYLALNTIIYENEILKVEKILKKAKESCIDAVICWDMSVMSVARKLKIPIHLSTQASVSNSYSAKFYKNIGVERIVLARECSIEDIKKIIKKSCVQIELFIHGAMCVSVSGRCFLSQELFNKSANRGECLQPCRRKYLIKDTEENHSLILGDDYVMSPKDLCTLSFIEKILKLNVDCLKIEGRNRSPEYVYTVTSAYKKAIDYYFNNKSKNNFRKNFDKIKKDLLKEIEEVYNRGFSSGFYLGKPMNEWIKTYGSKAKKRKIHVGKVIHFYNNIGVCEIKLEAKDLCRGDSMMIQGPTTGILKEKIDSIQCNHNPVSFGKKGEIIAVKVSSRVRKNDKVFVIK